MNWINEYVGIPFLVNGRDKLGCDCWGLILLVFREQYGIDLPDWTVFRNRGLHYTIETILSMERGIERAQEQKQAEQIEESEDRAIVIVKRSGRPYHVGICFGRYVLHTSEYTRGSVCQPAFHFNKEHGDRTYWRWRL